MEELIHTTDKYWDCECKNNYIHPKDQKKCEDCGAVAGEQPDSMVNEVKEAGLPL